MNSSTARQRPTLKVIAHIDLDAFYAQVEEQYHPQLKGQPIAVMQYNPFGDLATHGPDENRVVNDSNGSIIALGYGAARTAGVKRNMRGAEARKLCPELQLVQVPVCNGKSDLRTYRHHGQQVLDVLARSVDGVAVVCEKASIDESYLDCTAAAKHRLATRGAPWLVQSAPVNMDQIRVGLQARFCPEACCTIARMRLHLLAERARLANSCVQPRHLSGRERCPRAHCEQCVCALQAPADAAAGSSADEEQDDVQAQDMKQWLSRPAPSWTAEEELLAHGAAIIAEKRATVWSELHFSVSAGATDQYFRVSMTSRLRCW